MLPPINVPLGPGGKSRRDTTIGSPTSVYQARSGEGSPVTSCHLRSRPTISRLARRSRPRSQTPFRRWHALIDFPGWVALAPSKSLHARWRLPLPSIGGKKGLRSPPLTATSDPRPNMGSLSTKPCEDQMPSTSTRARNACQVACPRSGKMITRPRNSVQVPNTT